MGNRNFGVYEEEARSFAASGAETHAALGRHSISTVEDAEKVLLPLLPHHTPTGGKEG